MTVGAIVSSPEFFIVEKSVNVSEKNLMSEAAKG
jgi:hypothetical protein